MTASSLLPFRKRITEEPFEERVRDVMTQNPETCREHESIDEQVEKLERHTAVIVVDSAGRCGAST